MGAVCPVLLCIDTTLTHTATGHGRKQHEERESSCAFISSIDKSSIFPYLHALNKYFGCHHRHESNEIKAAHNTQGWSESFQIDSSHSSCYMRDNLFASSTRIRICEMHGMVVTGGWWDAFATPLVVTNIVFTIHAPMFAFWIGRPIALHTSPIWFLLFLEWWCKLLSAASNIILHDRTVVSKVEFSCWSVALIRVGSRQ